MALHYYHGQSTGIGFITHEDQESSHIGGYPGDIWVTENTQWAARVGLTEKTKEEAQTIVNNAIQDLGLVNDELHPTDPNGPKVIVLP